MLLQSHRVDSQGRTVIDLLPALPSAWEDGSVRGLRARGGVEVGILWEGSELLSARLQADRAGAFTIRHGGKPVTWTASAGETLDLNVDLVASPR